MKFQKFIFAFLFSVIFFSGVANGQDIGKYIENNHIDSVKYFLEQGYDINGIYPRYTMLELAIHSNNKDMVDWLIDHNANVNLYNNQYTPLTSGVIYGKQYDSNEIVEILVNHDANLDFKGFMEFTPFVLACKISNTPAAKLLFERGADYNIHDQLENDFYYYVVRGHDPQLIEYFISKGFRIPRTSSSVDGPYLSWKNDKTVEINYMHYDSLSDQAEWSSELVNIDQKFSHSFMKEVNLSGKDNGILIREKGEYKNVKEVFALSDIHGNFDGFIKLLKSNHIIDDSLNWLWGKGHLVICGDVLDRGDLVTECLWLIYKLENQAEKAGGKVHYLLGNHELMILKDNDKSSVHDKYILPFAKAGIDYCNLFEQNTVFGRWIRSKNVAEKINNILFVHGGIPPEFIDMGYTIDNMNQLIHAYLKENSDFDLDLKQLAIQPTWYRGYFYNIDQSKELKKIRNFYHVKHIVVGHTAVNEVKSIQDGTVIAIGVHYGETGVPAQGLLIKNKNFFCVDENGEKSALDPVSGL